MTVVDTEFLVIVQVWKRFATLHKNEEERAEFVCINVDKEDFYGSLNYRYDIYVGSVDEETWKKVQQGEEVRVGKDKTPKEWTLRRKA